MQFFLTKPYPIKCSSTSLNYDLIKPFSKLILINELHVNNHNHTQIYSQNLANRLRPDVTLHVGTSRPT